MAAVLTEMRTSKHFVRKNLVLTAHRSRRFGHFWQGEGRPKQSGHRTRREGIVQCIQMTALRICVWIMRGKGPFIKTSAQNREKLTLPSCRKMAQSSCPHWLNHFVHADTLENFQKFKVLLQQNVRTSASEDLFPHPSCPHWTTPPSEYGRRLWTAPY